MKQEQLLQFYPQQESYEDEIDLYELLDILIKHKNVVFITWIAIALLSLGGAFYIREQNSKKVTLNFKLSNSWENNPYYKNSGLRVDFVKYNEILDNKIYVDELFKTKGMRELYYKTYPENNRNLNTEMKFLKDNIDIGPVVIKNPVDSKSEISHYSITTDFKGNMVLGKELIGAYFNILEDRNREILKAVLIEESPRVEKKAQESNEKLELLEEEIRDSSEREIKFIQGKDLNLESLMKLKYEKLLIDKRQESSIYERSTSQMKALKDLSMEIERKKPTINLTSSFLEVKGKSKAMLILAVGSVLGLFVGISVAFIYEFIEGYRKRKEI